MGPVLLLISTLLSSYFHSGRTIDVPTTFTIRNITLAIEPNTDVIRDTNVTVRCKAIVSSSGEQPLSRSYTIYKDSYEVYTKTTSSSEDLLYPLPQARVSNTGKYKCKIDIEGRQMVSNSKKLTVTGLSRPMFHINKGVVTEGEEVTARCAAPQETGSIFFYFYEDSKEIVEERVSSNQAEVKLRFSSAGIRRIHCDYTVLITPDSIKSSESNIATVSVKELFITPVLEIFPEYNIYEGDRLDISCTIRNSPYSSQAVNLFLSQGTQLLSNGNSKVNYSMIALAKDSGEFECRLEMGNVVKVATKMVSVTELFSVPTLTMSPAEVFPGDDMRLTCRSENHASERLHRDEVTYTIYPLESHLSASRQAGVFSGKTLLYDFNYTCTAQAKGIVKRSRILTVRPKVSVSQPKISLLGKVIVGRPFEIRCQSDRGSLPINYTLWRKNNWLNTTTVKLPDEQAVFTITIQRSDEISQFMCEAQNNLHANGILSKSLNGTVTVPLSDPKLTVNPSLADIAEGDHIHLNCAIRGTWPVTFKWYRTGIAQPLYTTTSKQTSMDFQIPSLGSQDSGTYYCEAINDANNLVRSPSVTIEVHMAMWKKAVIVAACLLVVAVLVLLLVLRFKAKRGKREAAAELSVKPSSPKSDDSFAVNLIHDKEVYNAATVRVDKAVTSVWSERPANAASDEESSVASSEPDVEYTEVVHPQPADPARGAADHHDYGSVEYAELNAEQLEINHTQPEVNNQQDLLVPVD
ncbi:platelet endothelial cell adhesion molecule isoform X4 [Myripristis murdjan]|uniref:platelet endothelial cell adhesion molecule isoform X4 n=1 Tax=Myripristis murdjan TaxID=586833 RepID=UPI001175D638|nr:platelet endothelial cell adhesion molecule-like isoform X4 [Myripristis murdjan]